MSPRLRQSMFLLLMLGAVIAAASSIAIFSQRQMQLRGALDGYPDPALSPARVPILGVNADLTQYDELALAENLDAIHDTGFVWVRQVFDWIEIEAQRGEYDWSAYDRIVEQTDARDLRLVAVLWRSPDWAADSPTAPPNDLDAFGEFAASLASRYGEQIEVYQIWDEPNLSSGWGNQRPDVIDYVRLLETAHTAIHAADDTALVLTAGLAPNVETGPDNLSDILYLRALYENGAAPFFDGVAGKPYGFDTSPADRRVDPAVLNFSRLVLLREEMVAHGDSRKPLWGSHFGWNALPANWQGDPSVWGLTTPDQQAEWTVAAYDRALREWSWSGALILNYWQPDAPATDPRWGFALRSQSGDLSLTAEAIRAHNELYNSILWPGIYRADVPIVDYEGEWEFSDLGADISEHGGSVIKAPMIGSGMGVIARRDNYRAYLYVEVDDQPSATLPRDERGAYAILTSPDYQPRIEIIPLADSLTPEPHRIRIEADRGWDQWAIAGFAVANDVDTSFYDLLVGSLLIMSMVFVTLAVREGREIAWFGGLPQIAQRITTMFSQGMHLILALIAALAVWLGASLTWGGLVPSLLRKLGDGPSLLITFFTAGVFYYPPAPFVLTIIALILLFVLIYARPSIGLALIMFFTPYYLIPRPLFDRMFSMAEVTSLLTLAAWGLHIIADRKTRGWPTLRQLYQRMTNLDKAVALFIAISVASLSWADLKGVAFTELRQMIIEPFVVYLVLRTMPLTSSERWLIVDMLILTGVLVSLIGFYEAITGTDLIRAEAGSIRIRSVFGTPNNLALFLGRLIPISAAIVLIGGSRTRRVLYGIAGVLMLAAAGLTVSKGALLFGLPAALALVVILWAGKAGLIAVGAGLIALLLALIPLWNHPRFKSMLDFGEGSSFFRVQLWQSALRMIADHPITGVGLDQFLYLYRGRYILPSAWQQPDLSQPHNFLLNYWVRLGIVGLAAGVWMQLAFWQMAWRTQRALRAIDPAARALAVGLMGGMADFIAHGMVDEVYFVIDLAFIFFMTLGLIHQLSEQAQQRDDLSAA